MCVPHANGTSKHIAGSLNIPLNQLPGRWQEVHQTPLVLYQSGYRSAIAASLLERYGITTCADLVGGFAAWEACNSPWPALRPTAPERHDGLGQSHHHRMLWITLSKDTGEREKERSVLTLWRFVSLPDLVQHRLRALFPLVGIALGVAVFIAVRVTNTSTLGAFARTVDAIAGRAGLEITGRGHCWIEAVLPQARRVPGVAAVAPLILADVVVPEAAGRRCWWLAR